MTKNVNDVHSMESGYRNAISRMENAPIGERNKKLLKQFTTSCRHEGLKKSTITGYVNYGTRILQSFKELDVEKDLDMIDEFDFDNLLMHLEDEKGLAQSSLRNYKKFAKKFFGWKYDGDAPKWVKNLKLKTIDNPVQSHEILKQDEVDTILDSCDHPRDKALIAVLADGGLRIGALISCSIKHVEFTKHGAKIFISKTSQSRKTTKPKGIPLTWATGYLNQWLAVHPLKEDPEAPLWVTLNNNNEPVSYKTARATVNRIVKKAGIKKRVTPHSFRHYAITRWILDGLTEQEVKHRAGWSRGSNQMFMIYANFTDQELDDKIYEKYGIKTEDKRHVTLTQCPRCNNVLKPTDRFCSQCSLVLDQDMAEEIEQNKEHLPDGLEIALSDPELRKLLNQKLQESMKQKE